MYNENDYIEYRKDCLAHHGVKGQKWGVVHERNKFDKQGRLIDKSTTKEDNNLKRKYEYESSTRKDISNIKRQEEIQTHELQRKEAKQKVENGKKITKAILSAAIIGTMVVSSIIVKRKNEYAMGQAKAAKLLNKK